MRPRLRLFIGEDELGDPELAKPEVSMEFGEFSRILSDAIVWDRTWLADFAEEQIKLPADLYEVLLAYSQMKGSA